METQLYDPLDPQTLADPYPVFKQLRLHSPVFWHEGMQSWCLTRYADCVRVLRDHATFARDRRRLGQDVPEPSLSVQSLDPPAQAPIRSLFMNALRAQDIALFEQHATLHIFGLLADLAKRGPFDAMAALAAPVSVAMNSTLLGVEQPDVVSFAAVSDAIMRSMDGGLDPSVVEPGRRAREELSALVESWFATGTNTGGLLGHVYRHAPAASFEKPLSVYVRNTARVLFQGGYSTMSAAIGNAVETLLLYPDLLTTAGEARIATLAEELVRYNGPVQGTSRIATTPVTIGETAIEPGQLVVTLFASANRDPEQFPDPETLMAERFPNRHLGYGWGTHSCIGTQPAQAVLRALIRALIAIGPLRLRSAGAAVRRRTATMRVFDTLPVAFHR